MSTLVEEPPGCAVPTSQGRHYLVTPVAVRRALHFLCAKPLPS
jgi:hypothetical protein